jgi:ubiquinone/menaquinone biosynthesis C-methylase UbiE
MVSAQTTADTRGAGAERPIAAVDPEPIIRLASGFMLAKHLFAASELGLFEALAGSPATVDALAARTGLTRRTARISADAMVALGLLERRGNEYSNTDVAATFLAGNPGPDLRPLLRHWDKNSYPVWTEFAEALGRGPAHEIFELDEEHQRIASAGIEAILAGPANALARAFDFSPHRRLLDVGGGTGSWTIATARSFPHLEATILERSSVVGVARERVAAAGLASRVTVVAGDALADELPSGHDVFLLANLVHYWSPERNVALFTRIRSAAPAGARLLLADFWTDPTHTKPVQAAVMAGEFAVHLREGDVYSVEEVGEWLPEAGWRFVAHAPLVGPQSLIVAEAD